MNICPHDERRFCYYRHEMLYMFRDLHLIAQLSVAESPYPLVVWQCVAPRPTEAMPGEVTIVSLLRENTG